VDKIKWLKKMSKIIIADVLEMIGVGKKGHFGGSLSSDDLVIALYFYKLNHNPKYPNDSHRDRFIFSKGHSVLAQYIALAEWGYFSKSELKKPRFWVLYYRAIQKSELQELKQIPVL